MKKLLVLTLFMALVLSGCFGGKDLTPVERASVISSEVTKTYFSLYDTYQSLENVLEGDQLAALKTAADPLNKAKQCLITYNNLVIVWRDSGGIEPAELFTNKVMLDTILAEVSTILISLM